MPAYVVLYRFTEQGRSHIKDTVRRAEQIRRENEQRGFQVIGSWWTQGQYDLVAVVEAPSEQAMMSGLFNIAEAGNVASETMRAFTQREMEQAMRGAPRRGSTRKRATARKTARRTTSKRATTRRATRPAGTTRRKTARRTTRRR